MKKIAGILWLTIVLAGCKYNSDEGLDDNIPYRFVVLDAQGKNLIDSAVTITPQRPPYYRNYSINYPLTNPSSQMPTTKYGGYWLEIEPDYRIPYTINKGNAKLATLEFMGISPSDIKFNGGEPVRLDTTVMPFVFVLQLK